MAFLKKQVTRTTDGKVDPRTLASLYPEAKTFDQRAADDDERQKRFIKRQPRFARIKIAMYTSVLIAALVLYILGIHLMWKTDNTVSIFFSFAVALVLLFTMFGCIAYIAKVFYAFNRSMLAFILTEAVLLSAMLFLLSRLESMHVGSTLHSVAIAAGAHCVVMYGFLLAVIRYDH